MDDSELTVPIPLEDLRHAYATLEKMLLNYATGDQGWRVLSEARICIAMEVCEQYGYEEMVKLNEDAKAARLNRRDLNSPDF